MIESEILLLTPGPTPIHPRARAALTWPMRGHMDAEVFAYNDRIVADLHELYGSGPGAFACLLSGTGSLGMEAGFANLLEPGDRVVIGVNGVFGERMVEMARRLGAEVNEVRAPLGEPLDPAAIDRAAQRARPKAIAVVHGETSTGVLNPVPEIGEVARRHGALFTVDAVTTVGMIPFEMARWGIDYAYTGSQKCLSAPPGTAPVVFSERAMRVVASRSAPVATWYADAVGMRRYWEPGDAGRQYHHTVPVQLHWSTGEAIRAALEEGLEVRAERVAEIAEALLEALAPLGFTPFVAAPHRLPTVLAVTLPEGFADGRIRHALRHDFGISVTGGLGPTAGKIWRLGLMGESARPAHYRRLLDALGSLLDAPGLGAAFVAALPASLAKRVAAPPATSSSSP